MVDQERTPLSKFVAFQATPEMHQRIAGLAKSMGISRSEFLRRCVDVGERHLPEIREQGTPDHPRSRWYG